MFFASLLVLAASVRLRGYDFALPYIDHPDEPNFALTALWWRGEMHVFQNAQYPPGYIWFEMVVQTVMDAFGTPVISDYVRVLRLFAIAASLGTTLAVAGTAWRVGGRAAGFLAGLTWAIAPEIVRNGLFAIPDPFVYLLVSVSTYLAVEAICSPKRPLWALWSVLVALAATLVKYPAVPAILPGGLAALYVATKRDRPLGVRILAVQAIAVTAVGLWLVAGYGIVNYNEGATAQSEGLQRVTSLDLVRNNLRYVFYPLARHTWTVAGWGVVVVGSALALWRGRRRGLPAPEPVALLALWAPMIAIPWLATAFRTGTTQALRDILPGTTAAVALWAVSLLALARAGAGLLHRAGITTRRARAAAYGVLLVGFLAAYAIPQLVTTWQESTQRTYPDTRADVAAWAETVLDPGTVVVFDETHKMFNRYWGGYPGVKWFDSWLAEEATEHTPAEWRARGMSYLALAYNEMVAMQSTEESRAYLDQLLPLRVIPPHEQQRGPAMVFYRLWQPDVRQQADFGGQFRLIGWDQQPAEPQPGDVVTLRFYWQPIEPPRDNYSVFLHLTPADDPGQILAQQDFTPVSEQRLPLTWQYTDETLIGQPQTLPIPRDLAPGRYTVRLGLYDYVTGVRLPVTAPEGAPAEHVILLTIDVPES